MNNLARAYLAGKQLTGCRSSRRSSPAAEAVETRHPQFAGLLGQGRPLGMKFGSTPAEEMLRECLAIREKKEPEAWTTFDTKSMLGGALLGQKKYAEAEPLLLDRLRRDEATGEADPPQGRVPLPKPSTN